MTISQQYEHTGIMKLLARRACVRARVCVASTFKQVYTMCTTIKFLLYTSDLSGKVYFIP